MNEGNFKQLCDKALLLINGVSEEVFLYEDEKALVGAWGDCDVAYDDNTVGGVCGQPSGGGQFHCDGKLCGGGYGGAGGHQGAEERHREHGDGLGTFRLYRWRCGGSAYNDRAYG